MGTDEGEKAPERRGARGQQTRRPRRRGEERERLRAALADGYDGGASIRALCAEHGLSFGLARTLLLEAGVELRGRGSRTARKAALR